ncbi:MAG: ABC transporter substrate-binding protein [Gammaproteobacteria bacterium]|nr:ABC transporter substrate-binding protein [Gammaproteobacteria bacterium]
MIKQSRRIARAAVLVLGATVLLGTGSIQAADMGAKNEPIKLAMHEWTGQHITTLISGHVLEKMGYEVEFVTAGYLGAGTAIADGNLTASLEVWDNNLGEFFPKLLSAGKLEDLGDVGLDGKEGWIYPAHMSKKCPGLPAWDAFKSCAKKFASAETYPKGRFLEYPADWGDRSTQLIKAEKLDYTPIPAGSEGAMVAELKASVETETPLVMMFWAPHWILANVDVGWVDIPHEQLANSSMLKPRTFKVVWPGTKGKWPAAYEALKSIKITNAIQEPLMDLVDNQGKDAKTVTKAWVDQNEAVWKPWVQAAM